MDTAAGAPRRVPASTFATAHRAATLHPTSIPVVVRAAPPAPPAAAPIVIPAPAALVPRAPRPSRAPAPLPVPAAAAPVVADAPLATGVPAASWIDRNPSTAKRPVDATSRDGLHFLRVAFSLLVTCGAIGFGMYSAFGERTIARTPLGALTPAPAAEPETSVEIPLVLTAAPPPAH